MSVLAIRGGTPLRTAPFPGWTMITPADKEGLETVFNQADWGPDGPQNHAFQQRFAQYCGVKHCLTVANGTVSLELILRALGIGRGDEVIVPPYTFIATISSIIYAGATPVFADIEPDTFQLSAASAEKAITSRTRAIMPAYIGGRPADLDAFEALCSKYGLYLIGDAAQAVGSGFNGRDVGTYGIATSISCQNTKNLTCGEGGIILTNNDKLYEKLQQILFDRQHSYLTMDYGMSEFQASILNTQLDALAGQIDRRMDSCNHLDRRFDELPILFTLKKDPRITRNSHHLYLLGLHEEMLQGVSRSTFLKAVRAEGAPITPGYIPAYDFPCLAGDYVRKCVGTDMNLKPDTPVAERIGRHDGCWIYHSTLLGTRQDMDDIADAVIKVWEHLDELKEV